MRQTHVDFEEALEVFRHAKYDIMDVECKQFDSDFYLFQSQVRAFLLQRRARTHTPGWGLGFVGGGLEGSGFGGRRTHSVLCILPPLPANRRQPLNPQTQPPNPQPDLLKTPKT